MTTEEKMKRAEYARAYRLAHPERIRAASRKYKQKLRSLRGPIVRLCVVCGQSFELKRGNPKYCSDACRKKSARDQRRILAKQKRDRRLDERCEVVTVAKDVEDMRARVERDLQLPASERYEASKKWTAEQRAYAKKLWHENHKGRWE